MQKIEHYTDMSLTREFAYGQLKGNLIVVTWYTNSGNSRSITHSHPFYEIILCISGCTVTYSSGGDSYELHPGDVIIFPKNIYHSAKYGYHHEASDRLVVQIDSDLWENTAKMYEVADADWNHTVTLLKADAVKKWDLRGLFERMSLNAALNQKYKVTAFHSNLSELFMVICQIAQKGDVYKPTATSILVENTVQYIQEHYTDPELNVAQIVEHTYASRGYLSRVFKEYTSTSIHSYITDLRMQHCRQAITDGRSILEACSESGFSDYSSFLKTFRKLYGMTPTMFRASLKEIQ